MFGPAALWLGEIGLVVEIRLSVGLREFDVVVVRNFVGVAALFAGVGTAFVLAFAVVLNVAAGCGLD